MLYNFYEVDPGTNESLNEDLADMTAAIERGYVLGASWTGCKVLKFVPSAGGTETTMRIAY